MSDKRMIHAHFFESEAISELTIRQRLLIVGIITLADDQGRIRAHPRWLKSQIFPYDDIPADEIKSDLQAIANSNDTLVLYEVDGKAYAQLTNWWEYQALQWAGPSDYPAPDGWKDRVRQMVYKPKRWIMTINWPGAEDRLDYKVTALGNEAGDALPIINTNINSLNDDDLKDSIDNQEGADDWKPTPFSQLSTHFVNISSIPEYNGGARRWNDALKRLVRAGVQPEDITAAYNTLIKHPTKKYTIVGIQSVENAAYTEMSRRLNGESEPEEFYEEHV